MTESDTNESKICNEFIEALKAFMHIFHEIESDRGNIDKTEFLAKTARTVDNLYQRSLQASKHSHEDVEEIGNIVTNIFVQPLCFNDRCVTFLQAASEYNEENSSQILPNLMKEYVKHPETTKSFLKELEILQDDIYDILKEAS